MRKLNYLVSVLALLAMSVLLTRSASGDALYEGFKTPPAGVRPGVYWFWTGNTLSEKEILRELDLLKKAGIGSVLIFPMAKTLFAVKTADKELDWLSPEWVHMLKVARDGAKARGMYVDVLVGTGWPFGGPMVQPGDQIQMVQLGKKDLSGPGTFKGNIKDLMVAPKGVYGESNGSAPKLVFLRLMPETITEFEAGTELSSQVKPDGSIEFQIPPGKHVLYTGTWKEGFIIVNIPAPGDAGPVLDHFSAAATKHYLDHFAAAVEPVLGKDFGKTVRSLHCDSFEFTGANWTTDFLPQFEKRRGYALTPYLPLVLDWPGYQGPHPIADTVARVRWDYWKTLEELFDERFLNPMNEWTHAQGGKFRVEAYGCPSQDPLDCKLVADYPMGETWITIYPKNPHDETPIPMEASRTTDSQCIWSVMNNKYVSSGAHLLGRHTVSCETLTNDEATFRTNLQDIKQTCDVNYVSGINHPIFHGFNMNPPETGFPGWFFCGEYVAERNTWWPYFNKVNDYLARVSSVLIGTTPYAEVAVMDGDNRHWVWEALHQAGYCADYVSEKILRQADFSGGKIHYGPQTYEILVMNQIGSLSPEGAETLEHFAKAGGRIVFVGGAPRRAHGLTNKEAWDGRVRMAIDEILKLDPQRLAVVRPPRHLPQIPVMPGPEKVEAAQWAVKTLSDFGVRPSVEISAPTPLLYQIHQKQDGRDVFFFVNLDVTAPAAFNATFATGEKTAWRWDPETGRRGVYPHGTKKNELKIDLAPRESLLLVFEPTLGGKPAPSAPVADEAKALEIKTPWQVHFKPAFAPAFERTMPALIDFAKDPQLVTFAGTATYTTEFDAADLKHTMLALGEVHDISEVRLNGKPLGTRWWGDHTYDTAGALKAGKNVLEVKVTTVLFNYAYSLKNDPMIQRWLLQRPRRILSEGLLGPVRLCAAKE